MKGDFSRDTFRPKKRYSSVRMQQGRVQLDSDWNEQADIQNHRAQKHAADMVGVMGAPQASPGFEISVTDGNLYIGPGRYYVDGILCENEESILYTDQPDFPEAVLPPLGEDGLYLAYLDVWERHVTAIEDPELGEVALGGPDTATRTKTVWQVKLLPVTADEESGERFSGSNFPEWEGLINAQAGQMTARVGAWGRPNDNRLYRVEIHDSASFKWSRDNGATLAKVESISTSSGGNEALITASMPGRLINREFEPGNWVEISDRRRVLNNEPGVLARVGSVEGDELTLLEWPEVTALAVPLEELVTIRRWDGKVDIESDADIKLENGIEVRFEYGILRNGDYWTLPAREATGNILWPRDGSVPIAQPPAGIRRGYSPLASAQVQNGEISIRKDFRAIFPPLTQRPSPVGSAPGRADQISYDPANQQNRWQHLWLRSFPEFNYWGQLAADFEGNIFVTGSPFRQSAAETYKVNVLKLDSHGIHVWLRSFESYGSNYWMALDGSGNVVVMGQLPDDATSGLFIQKLDREGNSLWEYTLEGLAVLKVGSIATDGEKVVVTGSFSGGLEIEGTTLGVENEKGLFVVKLTSDGTLDWALSFKIIDDDPENVNFGGAVASDSSGSIFVTGSLKGELKVDANKSLTSENSSMFLLKLDENGGVLRAVNATNIAGESRSGGRFIAVDGNGDVYVTAKFRGSVEIDGTVLNARGSEDAFTCKYNSSGNFEWGSIFEELSAVFHNRPAIDGENNVYLAGKFLRQVEAPGSLEAELYLLKLDGNGQRLWSANFPGTSDFDAEFDQIAVDGAGDLLVAGHLTGSMDFGGGPLTGIDNDPFLLKLRDDLPSTVQEATDLLLERDRNLWDTLKAEKIGFLSPLDTSNVQSSPPTEINTVVDALQLLSDIKADRIPYDPPPGQPSTLHVWSHRFENKFYQYEPSVFGDSVVVDDDGNVIVAGRFSGILFLGGTPLFSSGTTLFVVKFDSEGKFLWANPYYGGFTFTAVKLAVDKDGSILFTGSFTGRAFLDPPTDKLSGVPSKGSGFSMFVSKIHPDGTADWLEIYGYPGASPSAVSPRAIAVDPGNRVVITGKFRGSVDFVENDPDTSAAEDLDDLFVLKLEPTGDTFWRRHFSGSGNDQGSDVAIDNDHNVWVTGMISESATFEQFSLEAAGISAAFVLKLDPYGTPLFAREIQGASYSLGTGIAVDGNGKIAVMGIFSGELTFGQVPLASEGSGLFVLRLDAEGEHLWFRHDPGTAVSMPHEFGNFGGSGIILDLNGNAVVLGSFGETVDLGGGALTSDSGDLFLLKLDASGRHVWSFNFDGNATQIVPGIALGPGGDIAVGGSFHGTVNFGGENLTSVDSSLFVLKMRSALPTAIQEATDQLYKLYTDLGKMRMVTKTYHPHLTPFKFGMDPEFLSTRTGMFAPAGVNAVAKIPLDFPDGAHLSKLEVTASPNMSFGLTVEFLKGERDASQGSSIVTLEFENGGMKYQTLDHVIEKDPGDYFVLITVDTPHEYGDIYIDYIRFDYAYPAMPV